MAKVCIIGVTISGNMGGQAMLYSVMQNIKKLHPQTEFDLLTIYYSEDKKFKNEDINLIQVNPLVLISVYLPLSILLAPFIKLGSVRNLLKKNSYFNSLLSSDILVDLGGITFVDGRGIELLLYNTACTLPGIMLGIPTFKLSQAMGPFKQTLNRLVSKRVLDGCEKVVARGRITMENLVDLGVDNKQMNYDTAFCLEVDQFSKNKAEEVFKKLDVKGGPVIIISPSKVVEKECSSVGIDFKKELLDTIDTLSSTGKKVVLLAHSLRDEAKSKNNDIELCEYLYSNSDSKSKDVFLVPHQTDSRILRELIGFADVFVGCRFHSIVSALSNGVPTVALAWSHKYKEMIEPFKIDDYVLDFHNFNKDELIKYLKKAENNKVELKKKILSNLTKVKTSSQGNFDLVTNFLLEVNNGR